MFRAEIGPDLFLISVQTGYFSGFPEPCLHCMFFEENNIYLIPALSRAKTYINGTYVTMTSMSFINTGLYPSILEKGPWAKLGKNYRQKTKIGNTISPVKCQEQNLILCCFLDWLMPVGSDLHPILA